MSQVPSRKSSLVCFLHLLPFPDQIARFFGEGFRVEFESVQDIEQAVDARLGVEKFVYHGNFARLDDAIAALKAAFFITNLVVQFVKHVFQFF